MAAKKAPVQIMEDEDNEPSNLLVDAPAPKAVSGVNPASVMRVAPQVKAPTMRILLEENVDIPPVGLFLGYNGMTFMLRPGVWVDAPTPLIEILDNAVGKVPDLDPNTKQIIGWRDKLRFPYRVQPGQYRNAA